MQRSTNWDSWGARLYHVLGLSYYLYNWIISLGIATGLGAFFLRSNPFALVLLLNLAFVLIAVGLFIWLNATKKRLQVDDPHVEFLSETTTYDVSGAPDYSQTRAMTIRSLRVGIVALLFRFRWTGTGPWKIFVSDPDCTVLTQEPKDDSANTFQLIFKRPLPVKVKKKIVVTYEMTDDNSSARPFLGKAIRRQYRQGTSMTVILPQGRPFIVRKEIVLYSQVIWQKESREMDQATWKVRHPRLGEYYRLTWRECE